MVVALVSHLLVQQHHSSQPTAVAVVVVANSVAVAVAVAVLLLFLEHSEQAM
jgi:hypothetical protein